jgi:hypothetical protein
MAGRLRTKPTQCEKVLKWFESHRTISAWEASHQLAIMALHSRISDLRQGRGPGGVRFNIPKPHQYITADGRRVETYELRCTSCSQPLGTGGEIRSGLCPRCLLDARSTVGGSEEPDSLPALSFSLSPHARNEEVGSPQFASGEHGDTEKKGRGGIKQSALFDLTRRPG